MRQTIVSTDIKHVHKKRIQAFCLTGILLFSTIIAYCHIHSNGILFFTFFFAFFNIFQACSLSYKSIKNSALMVGLKFDDQYLYVLGFSELQVKQQIPLENIKRITIYGTFTLTITLKTVENYRKRISVRISFLKSNEVKCFVDDLRLKLANID